MFLAAKSADCAGASTLCLGDRFARQLDAACDDDPVLIRAISG